jgi:anti-sigma factor RsiW
MDMTLDSRIEAYLDGTLSPEETHAFEAELAQAELSRAFSEALMIRTAFRTPVELPDDLVDRVSEALGAAIQAEVAAGKAPSGSTVRAVLGSFGWIFRGPGLAVLPGGGSGGQTRAGFGTIRYAWAPVSLLRKPRQTKANASLSRRLVTRLLRRGK